MNYNSEKMEANMASLENAIVSYNPNSDYEKDKLLMNAKDLVQTFEDEVRSIDNEMGDVSLELSRMEDTISSLTNDAEDIRSEISDLEDRINTTIEEAEEAESERSELADRLETLEEISNELQDNFLVKAKSIYEKLEKMLKPENPKLKELQNLQELKKNVEAEYKLRLENIEAQMLEVQRD